jgi:uncharacterized Fe-S cluster-containing radical SAM superfamily enzyme
LDGAGKDREEFGRDRKEIVKIGFKCANKVVVEVVVDGPMRGQSPI